MLKNQVIPKPKSVKKQTEKRKFLRQTSHEKETINTVFISFLRRAFQPNLMVLRGLPLVNFIKGSLVVFLEAGKAFT